MTHEQGILLESKSYAFKGTDGKDITGTNLTVYERSTRMIIFASTNEDLKIESDMLPATCVYLKEYKHGQKGIKCKLSEIDIIESI